MVQGGSTISQQLAKLTFLTPERSLVRKIKEALYTLWIEARFDKNEILEAYLNRLYLGSGAYGVDGAAQQYFDKPASALTLAESAMIAGLIQAPSRYAPTRDLRRAQARAARGHRQHAARRHAEPRAGGRRQGRARPPRPAEPARRRLLRRLGGGGRPPAHRDAADQPRDPHHPRSDPAARRRDDGQGHPGAARRAPAGRPGGPGGDEFRRQDPRDAGRPRLCPEPVQPRHPGAASARLGVQAVRLPRSPRGRRHAGGLAVGRADRGRRLAAAQLRGQRHGSDAGGRRLRPLGQHRLGAPGRACRPRQGDRHGASGSASPRSCATIRALRSAAPRSRCSS